VAPSFAFLGGVALSDPAAGVVLFLSLTATLPLLAGKAGSRGTLRFPSLILWSLLGAAIGWHASLRHEARISWLPADGRYVAREIWGRVVDAPLPDLRGDRLLTLAGGPLGDRAAVANIRLRVRTGTHRAWVETLDALRRGDLIRTYARVGVPRRGDSAIGDEAWRALRARGIDATGSVKSAGLVERLDAGGASPGRILEGARIHLRGRLQDSFPEAEPTRGLVAAMLLGECSEVRPETYRLLRDAGLVHIVSISGLHVGFLILLVLAVLRRTPAPIAISAAAAAAGLGAFGFMVGARAPVLRAVGCAALVLLGRVVSRGGNAVNSAAVVAAVLVAARPSLLADIGFQLTFLAVFGILLLAVPIAGMVPFHRSLGTSVGVSAGAYLSTLCAVAWHFGTVAPIALLSNLFAAPLCAWILSAGGATLVLAGVPVAGTLAADAARLGIDLLLRVAEAAAALPGASFRVAAPAGWLAAIFALLLGLSARLSSERSVAKLGRAPLRFTALAAMVLLARIHLGPWPDADDRTRELVVVDVGQGQSVIVRGSGGGCVLVDAGGTADGQFDTGERIVAPWLAQTGCRRLAAVVVTHDHDDHAGGAAAILREFEVDELWYPVATHRHPRTRALIDLARARGVATIAVARGFAARRAGIALEILHPTRHDRDLGVNDRSIVTRVTTDAGRVLIAGDLGAAGEDRLLAAGIDPDSGILVVGHHGADGASTREFLERVRPRTAVISVGAWNRFGHPSERVLVRLSAIGARTYRTDRDGSIRLRATRRGWEVRTSRVSRRSAASE
jgi:competence protein ComEC